MSQKLQLGDLQLAIMNVIWEQGSASARDVHTALLEERGLAVSTIKTMLRKMEDRGIVKHNVNGRQFIYKALIAEADVRNGMVDYLVRRIFSGDNAALVNHLIESGDIDSAELDDLRASLSKKRNSQKRKVRG